MNKHLCREEILSVYIDGELTRDECTSVEKHLKGCSECSAFVDEISLLSTGLAAIPRLEAEPVLVSQIMSRVRLAAAKSPDLLFDLFEMWGAFSLVSIAVLGFLMYSIMHPLLVILRGIIGLAFSIGKYLWRAQLPVANLLAACLLIAIACLVFYWFIRIHSNSDREEMIS